MDGKELVRQIEVKLSELGMKKKEFYALTGINANRFLKSLRRNGFSVFAVGSSPTTRTTIKKPCTH